MIDVNVCLINYKQLNLLDETFAVYINIKPSKRIKNENTTVSTLRKDQTDVCERETAQQSH